MSSTSSGAASEDLSSLSSIGINFTINETTKFVVHTSSIPLASEFNSTRLYNLSVTKQREHRNCANCSYETNERVHESCPCLVYNKPAKCFLDVLKQTGANISPGVQSENPKDYAFCSNGRSIFDNKYSRYIRTQTGVSGWGSVTPRNLVLVANNIYWFKKYNQELGLDKLLFGSQDDDDILVSFKQTVFTLNGLLIKRFLVFPDLISSYSEIAEQTARLFKTLFVHYRTQPNRWVESERGPYLEIKEFLNHIKRNFHVEEARTRHNSLINFAFKYEDNYNFFPELHKLHTKILDMWNDIEEDYTKSPAWIYRMTTLAQTRVIGYLPKCISYYKGVKYRENLQLEPEIPGTLTLIRRLIIEELIIKRVSKGLLTSIEDYNEYITTQDELEASQSFVAEAASTIDFNIRTAASSEQTVREGGKLEDARRAIELIRNQGWKIPVRSLRTNDIKEYLQCPQGDDTPDYHGLLFWFSYQTMLNDLVDKGQWPETDRYNFYINGTEIPWEPPDVWLALITIVKEPGKDRYLTMSNSFYTWSLIPCGKILNQILAVLPEHTIGLKGASDGWSYSQDIGPDADNTGFIYTESGSTKKTFQYFQDWVEATDNINKHVGVIMVKALMDYAGFPEKYGFFCLTVLYKSQNYIQNVKTANGQPFQHKGLINNGFMMGNPMTKTILHLCHVVDTAGTRRVLEGREVTSHPRTWQGPRPLLQRNFVSQTFIQDL